MCDYASYRPATPLTIHSCCKYPTCNYSLSPPYLQEPQCEQCGAWCKECKPPRTAEELYAERQRKLK